MRDKFIITGIILLATAIMLGAFGAHGLKKVVDETAVHTFEVGVKYQTYQGLGFLVLASLVSVFNFKLTSIFRLLLIGTLLFSLSIYALVLLPILHVDLKMVFGPITPLGGLLMITGWLLLLVKFLKNRPND